MEANGALIFTNIFFVFSHFGVTLPVEKADKSIPSLLIGYFQGIPFHKIKSNFFQVSQTVSIEIDV